MIFLLLFCNLKYRYSIFDLKKRWKSNYSYLQNVDIMLNGIFCTVLVLYNLHVWNILCNTHVWHYHKVQTLMIYSTLVYVQAICTTNFNSIQYDLNDIHKAQSVVVPPFFLQQRIKQTEQYEKHINQYIKNMQCHFCTQQSKQFDDFLLYSN